MNTLKVGDRVYIFDYSKIVSIQTINKITKTMAKSANYSFDLDINDNGFLRIKGLGKWNSLSAYIESPELIEKLKLQNVKHWFSTKNFTDQQKIEIYEKYK